MISSKEGREDASRATIQEVLDKVGVLKTNLTLLLDVVTVLLDGHLL